MPALYQGMRRCRRAARTRHRSQLANRSVSASAARLPHLEHRRPHLQQVLGDLDHRQHRGGCSARRRRRARRCGGRGRQRRAAGAGAAGELPDGAAATHAQRAMAMGRARAAGGSATALPHSGLGWWAQCPTSRLFDAPGAAGWLPGYAKSVTAGARRQRGRDPSVKRRSREVVQLPALLRGCHSRWEARGGLPADRLAV